MKGVILAGGLATRLRPLTLVTNKHLLPIYHQPMIYYPLQAMQNAGITEVLLTTSGDHAGDFANLLQDGHDFGMTIYYAIQKNPKGGIADAISLARDFVDKDSVLVLLGDNIFTYNLRAARERYEKRGAGAMIFGVHKDTESRQYGVIDTDAQGKVLSIEEKPEHPKSDIAQTGIYMYDHHVFDFIKNLTPSGRGELEVTDLNMEYLKANQLYCEIIDWWVDAGTSFDELLHANNQVAKMVEEGKL